MITLIEIYYTSHVIEKMQQKETSQLDLYLIICSQNESNIIIRN